MALTLEHCAVVGGELALAFGDGREVFLPLPMLGRACPCASCQREPDALGRVIRPKVEHGPDAFEMKGIDVVGGYAIQPRWADGHATGIYTFAYLLKLAGLDGSRPS